MSKADIGILTLSSAENYGAILQAYSLSEFINENFSSCEIIDFVPTFIIGRYPVAKIDTSSGKALIKSTIMFIPRAFIEGRKKYRFLSFKRKYCRFSKAKYISEYSVDEYKQYIVGSDQVLNLPLTQFDLNFFLPNIEGDRRKATYAASLGVSSTSEKENALYTKYLPGFTSISIREEKGKEIIESLLNGKTIETNIDSVFLHDTRFWEKFISKPAYKYPYILIYSFVSKDRAYEIARKVDSKIRIISIDNRIRREKDIQNARSVGPLEFLNLIYHASYIITDSFHGTAFSIIFHKNFYVIPYPGTESRMVNLLSLIGIQGRIYNNDTIIEDVNFDGVDDRLEILREKSYRYLKNFIK